MFYNDPSFDSVSPHLVGNGGRGVCVTSAVQCTMTCLFLAVVDSAFLQNAQV